MNNNIIPIAKYNKIFDNYLPSPIKHNVIYKSNGLEKHISKRHPDCIKYITLIPLIIASPDYIGVNPNETGTSFELVKSLDNHVQIGIKLDCSKDYLYVATLHTITDSKLNHGIKNGRLKKFQNKNVK